MNIRNGKNGKCYEILLKKLKLLILTKESFVEEIEGDFGGFKFEILLKTIGENPNMLIAYKNSGKASIFIDFCSRNL